MTVNIKKHIHPNTLNFYEIPNGSDINYLSPNNLLNSKRLDVVARIIYAQAKISNIGCKWAEYVYSNLINSQTNNFTKGSFDPGRTTMPEYIEQFDNLIQSISQNGYDDTQLVIPTCQETIIDGAHRLAISVAQNINKIPTIELDGAPQKIAFSDMVKYGMDMDAVNEIARQFILLKPQSRCAVLFPSSSSAHSNATKTLTKHFDIDFQIDVPLSFSGMERLQTILYGQHEWWTYKNANDFAKKRYKAGQSVTFIFFQETKEVRPVKEEMRTHHVLNNHALHTTDSHQETIEVANIFLNKNAIFWLNNTMDKTTPNFDKLLSAYKKIITDDNNNHVCLDTGAVMALHGLRDVSDLDYISINNKKLPESEHDIALHQGEYEQLGLTSEEIITNPKYHFIHSGVKYISLEILADLKKQRNTSKDNYDLSLIRYIKNKDKFIFSIVWGKFKSKVKYKIYLTYYRIHDFIVFTLRKILPTTAFNKIQNMYRKIKGQ